VSFGLFSISIPVLICGAVLLHYTDLCPHDITHLAVRWFLTHMSNAIVSVLQIHCFFLIVIVAGRVESQLGSLGTAATDRPIMPAPGDNNDGEIGGMIGRGI
jgi:hypothetical protein